MADTVLFLIRNMIFCYKSSGQCSSYHQQKDESDQDTFLALGVKCGIELQVFLDEKERIPQRRPVGCQRYKEESRVDSNEDQSVIKMFDANVEEIGRR